MTTVATASEQLDYNAFGEVDPKTMPAAGGLAEPAPAALYECGHCGLFFGKTSQVRGSWHLIRMDPLASFGRSDHRSAGVHLIRGLALLL